MTTQTFEAMASALEASGNFRVLRRLDARRACRSTEQLGPLRTACCVDVETTGLDGNRGDEIIQLSMFVFRYSSTRGDARVVEILSEFNRYRQPKRPISRAITELTSIDNATVAGHTIDPKEVAAFLAPYDVDFFVAHNAKFDQQFLMQAYPETFVNRQWRCSLSGVPWGAEAFRGRGLAFLAMQAGWFCRSHDAAEDCQTLLALLSHPLPVTGRTPLSYLVSQPSNTDHDLVSSAAVPKVRIRAVGAPFERRAELKARGYQWFPGSHIEPKAWFVDVAKERRDAELAYLNEIIPGGRTKAVVQDLDPAGR